MSGTDDAPFDMTANLPASDADLDRLLRGHTPAERPDLAGATAFVAAVAGLGTSVPEPKGALAALLADGFDPAALPAAPAARPRSRWSAVRRPAARLAGVSLAAKVLAGTGVAVAAVTGAAGTGSLPGPVQDRVGQVLETVTPFEFPPSQDTSPPKQVVPVIVPPPADETPAQPAPTADVRPEPPAQPSGPRPPAVRPSPPAQTAPPARPSGRPSARPATPVRPSERPAERPTSRPARPTPSRAGEAPDRGGPGSTPRGGAPATGRPDSTGPDSTGPDRGSSGNGGSDSSGADSAGRDSGGAQRPSSPPKPVAVLEDVPRP